LANTLSFALWELAKSSDFQERLFAEVVDIKLKDPGLSDAVLKLNFLDQILKEAQRRHSIVGAIHRNTSKSVKILGYPIDTGTRIAINIRAFHMNPEYYHNPETFNPDRWATGLKVPYTFLSFADGPHNCIGKKMAEIEFKVVLISLVQMFPNLILFYSLQSLTSFVLGYHQKILYHLTFKILVNPS
jgi:cytochrome P450